MGQVTWQRDAVVTKFLHFVLVDSLTVSNKK